MPVFQYRTLHRILDGGELVLRQARLAVLQHTMFTPKSADLQAFCAMQCCQHNSLTAAMPTSCPAMSCMICYKSRAVCTCTYRLHLHSTQLLRKLGTYRQSVRPWVKSQRLTANRRPGSGRRTTCAPSSDDFQYTDSKATFASHLRLPLSA